MSEEALIFGAVAFELGLPVLLVLLAVYVPSLRALSISVLGAITPLLVVYLALGVFHVMDPIDSDWAFSAVWLMTFFAYLLLVAVGLFLGFWRKPRGLVARYVLAALVAPVCAGLVLAAYGHAA